MNEAQRIGYQAEQRVEYLATQEGYEVFKSVEGDYAQKTDMWIEGQPVQISVKEKSRQQRDTLKKRGIFCVIAGQQLADTQVLQQINFIVNQE